MSTVKISQLPEINHLNTNTDQTLVVGVDTVTGETGKITVTTLAEGLYSNNALKVGLNQVQGANVIAQFTGNSSIYLQSVIQNFDANGSSDMVAMTSDSDNITRFVDMGINGADFSDPTYSSMKPYDAYLFNMGYQENSYTGNLVVGTASSHANIVFIVGGTTATNIVGRISTAGYDFYRGLKLLTGDFTLGSSGKIVYGDATQQDTAAAPANYTQSAFDTANTATVNTVLLQDVNLWQNTQIVEVNQYAAASFGQSNTNSSAITQLQNINTTQNTSISDVNGYTFSAYAYANTNANNIVLVNQFAGGAYAKANAALANTTGTFAGDLTISGNLTASSILTTKLVSFVSSTTPATNALVEIIGSTSGLQQSPAADGYMLHITGKDDVPNRVILDSFGANSYPLIAGRRGRGTADSPIATANGDVLMRISSGGWGTTGFAPLGSGRIDFIATENYTDTARGSRIDLFNCADGSNTIVRIASFNSDTVEFTGSVRPDKGFIYTPRVLPGSQTAITVDFTNDSIIKASLTADLTLSFSNYTAGKVVEVWLTNTGGTGRTVTHGCSATNSSENATTFTIPSTSSAYLRYFSIDGDLANTFVSSMHA